METGDQIRVSLRVRDDEFQPTRAEDYPVFFRRPEGEPQKRLLRAIPAEPGSFQGTFTLDTPGSMSVLVHDGANPSGPLLAREDVLVKFPDREMARSSQDRGTLEAIATASKDGRYVFLAGAGLGDMLLMRTCRS